MPGNTYLPDDEDKVCNKISSLKKVTRYDKKIFIYKKVVEAVRYVVNVDRKDINMGSKGNDEGVISVSNIVKNS